MARKMKKFSAGGAQGRYDRRMTDIDKDFKKDSAGKTGKALEVLEAKRAQRTADAKDDLAKRTGADRTATRAAERLAESNLTKTRKYGAPQSVTKDTAGPTGKVTDTLGAITAPKSELASKPSSFKEAFKEARSRLGAGKTFTFGGKSYTTNIAGEGRKPVQKPAQKAAPTPEKKVEKTIAPSKFDSKAFADLKAKMPKPTVTTTGGTALRGKPGAPLVSGTDTRAFFTYGKAAAEKNAANKAKGGAVKKETTMKYRSGGSTPPKPTAADRAADAKFRKSIKNLKPTPEQAAAIGRANRSSGYAKGGKVKKMAVGGMAPATPTTPTTPAVNTAARATTPAPNAMTPNTAARATTPAGAPPQSSATAPQMVKSATINTNTGVRTPSMFDRNASLQSFNAQARALLNQGVPMKEIVAQQGILRKLQMDNSSNSGQHSAALANALKRMQSLVPAKKAAKGGSMKAANKSGRALVKKSADTEGRAMKKFAAGGLTSGHKAANGVAKKGLTKGKQVKMNKGGACYAKGGSVRSIDGIATKGKTRCKGARK